MCDKSTCVLRKILIESMWPDEVFDDHWYRHVRQTGKFESYKNYLMSLDEEDLFMLYNHLQSIDYD